MATFSRHNNLLRTVVKSLIEWHHKKARHIISSIPFQHAAFNYLSGARAHIDGGYKL